MEFAGNLKRLRKAAGYTQEALAEKLHLTGQAVSRWETGEGYPEITLLPALADLLGVTVDSLLRNAELTGEEMYAIAGEANRLEQSGQHDKAVALLEEQLRKHPGADDLRDRLASSLLGNARRLRKDGKTAQAETDLRKAEEAAEALLNSDDPWYRYRAETKLPELYYLLGERSKLKKLHPAYVDPYYSSLSNCAVGKDFYYLFERAILSDVNDLSSHLGILAWRPSGKEDAWYDPDRPGDPLIYSPWSGEGEWSLSLEERYEIERLRGELLELFSGGAGFGVFRDLEINTLRLRLDMAAEMKDKGRLLDTLTLYVERFAKRELVKWEKKRVLASGSFRMALAQQARKGSESPEAEAIALLTPAEQALMTEPVSPLPAFKHLQLCRVFMRDPPMLPRHLQQISELLEEKRFDFARQEARFRAAEETLAALVTALEAEGELPPKNPEARRGIADR